MQDWTVCQHSRVLMPYPVVTPFSHIDLKQNSVQRALNYKSGQIFLQKFHNYVHNPPLIVMCVTTLKQYSSLG